MKITVLDGAVLNPGDLTWKDIEALGELTVYDRTSFTESPLIAERIGTSEIAVTNKTPISAETMDKCPALRLIAVVATGYNVVDVKAASERGITVCNVPAYGTNVVAQFATGLMLEITSHIGEHSRSVHEGKWQNCPEFCYWDYPLMELYGRTAGVIGLGNIGRALSKILSAMGLNVLGYSPSKKDIPEDMVKQCSLEEIYADADIIFLCCPLTDSNREMINASSIEKMKDGVIIINTGRGPLINEQDLADALRAGKVYGAGVDVVSAEPIHADNPLLSAPNCIITPHIAWAAKEARQRIIDITCDNIKAFLQDSPKNTVS